MERLAAKRRACAAPLARTQGNVQVAPWANPDATPRVIALVGPQHFAISREEDLPRVLAIAAARAGREQGAPQGAGSIPPTRCSPWRTTRACRSRSKARQFVRRGRRGVPEPTAPLGGRAARPRVELRGTFTYADGDAAADGARLLGLACATATRRNTLVAMLGLSDPLKQRTIEHKAARCGSR